MWKSKGSLFDFFERDTWIVFTTVQISGHCDVWFLAGWPKLSHIFDTFSKRARLVRICHIFDGVFKERERARDTWMVFAYDRHTEATCGGTHPGLPAHRWYLSLFSFFAGSFLSLFYSCNIFSNEDWIIHISERYDQELLILLPDLHKNYTLESLIPKHHNHYYDSSQWLPITIWHFISGAVYLLFAMLLLVFAMRFLVFSPLRAIKRASFDTLPLLQILINSKHQKSTIFAKFALQLAINVMKHTLHKWGGNISTIHNVIEEGFLTQP